MNANDALYQLSYIPEHVHLALGWRRDGARLLEHFWVSGVNDGSVWSLKCFSGGAR